jgi:hypothetical protein
VPAARRDDSRRASVAICRIISDFLSISGTGETIERMRAADNPFLRKECAAGDAQLGDDAGEVVADRRAARRGGTTRWWRRP